MRHRGRICARLFHKADSALEQIQFLLGHVSPQITERHLDGKQRFRDAVNDRIGTEPDVASWFPARRPTYHCRELVVVG
jgi:hypothetical protein